MRKNIFKTWKAFLKWTYSIVYKDIIITQLRWRFLGMNKIAFNFSVLQPATLQHLNDTDLLEKVWVFIDPYKKDISISFSKKILCFWSYFRHEIETSPSVRELADLLIIKNYFISSSFQAMLCIPVISHYSYDYG